MVLSGLLFALAWVAGIVFYIWMIVDVARPSNAAYEQAGTNNLRGNVPLKCSQCHGMTSLQ